MKTILFLLLLLSTESVLAMPKITVIHQRNAEGFAKVQVKNTIMENLICYVAIDGHKNLFRLKPIALSKWYTATDKRFNHANFSIWCDYLKLHPKYQKK